MTDSQKQLIRQAVNKFGDLAHINDTKAYEEFVEKLSRDDMDRAIDVILVSLNSLLKRNLITQEDIFANSNLILALDPEHYKTEDDLIARLKEIQAMNMEYPRTSLEENHRLALETFDKFNELIQGKFDCFYTGGFVGYLATNTPLSRYHGDLDLFINEEQLEQLQELLAGNPDFSFVSNMDHKEERGHEFKVTYKDSPMSIGLFLFERLPDTQSIVIKEYFHERNNPEKDLFVNEYELSPISTALTFPDEIREHNGIPYKMQSLEAIFSAKKHSRPKDRRDAEIIKPSLNMDKLKALHDNEQKTTVRFYQHAGNSIVAKIENKAKQIPDNSGFGDR